MFVRGWTYIDPLGPVISQLSNCVKCFREHVHKNVYVLQSLFINLGGLLTGLL